MTDLSELRRPEGAHRARKRLGRGPGSGLGKTSGKGHKGHKARTGTKTRPWFEGGQMPLQRRVPKRGFKNPFRVEYEIVNLRDLARLGEVETITPELLAEHRLIDLGKRRPVKVLGTGEIERKVTVRAHAVSAGARTKIEAAGGTVELLES
jgi:large subunit ribosomal protein L15